MADKRPVNRVTPKRRTSGTPQDSSSRRALGREGQPASTRRTSADADHPRASTAHGSARTNTGGAETRAAEIGATKAGAEVGSAKAESAKARTAKAESAKTRSAKAEIVKTGSANTGTAKARTAKAEIVKTGSANTGTAKAGVAKTGTTEATGFAKAGLAKVGLVKTRAAVNSSRGRSASRGADAASGPDRPARGGSWRLAIGCGLAAVLLGVFAVVAALRPGVDDDNLAYVDNQATDEVKAAADHALSTLYGYRAAEIDRWKDDVGAVLTERMRADLEKYIDTTVSTIKQAATDTEVTTDPIGVTLLTSDRAELLVNLNVSAVRDGTPEPLASGPVVLRMQKVDGRWLAAEIADN
ncbi:hypothetical protein [Nocardia sp. CC227C]|uniref:hypothetical protein n=1 Tax=Nocardia sp. CC227C TaxID=3044562 RepID=UPI00278C6336|nr:hypothetical protein [Nocardia sp. CC227C]